MKYNELYKAFIVSNLQLTGSSIMTLKLVILDVK